MLSKTTSPRMDATTAVMGTPPFERARSVIARVSALPGPAMHHYLNSQEPELLTALALHLAGRYVEELTECEEWTFGGLTWRLDAGLLTFTTSPDIDQAAVVAAQLTSIFWGFVGAPSAYAGELWHDVWKSVPRTERIRVLLTLAAHVRQAAAA